MSASYAVCSGELRAYIEFPNRVEAREVADAVIERDLKGRGKPTIYLGRLLSVSGEQFVEGQVMFFSTERLLRDHGLWSEA